MTQALFNHIQLNNIIEEQLAKTEKLKSKLNRLKNRINKNAKQFELLGKKNDQDTTAYNDTFNELTKLAKLLDKNVQALKKSGEALKQTSDVSEYYDDERYYFDF